MRAPRLVDWSNGTRLEPTSHSIRILKVNPMWGRAPCWISCPLDLFSFWGGVVDVFTDWDCTMGWIRHHFSPPCTSKSKVTLIDLESPFFHRTHLGGIFWFRFIACPVFRSGSLKWDEHHLWKKPGWLKKVREVMILFPGVERLGGPFKSYPPLKEGWVLQHV